VRRNQYTVNKSCNFFVKFTVKQHIIIQYKILEDKKFVLCGVYCCGMMYTDDALS